jgi:BMFP domain-containing protein YqiC
MQKSKVFDELNATLNTFLPKNLQRDIEKNLRTALHSVFNRLNLVTREELEVQEAVLLRTRGKLQVLEKKLAELEKNS